MFTQTTVAQAATQKWDVIIAGSSFAAMFFLRGLPKDLRVLIVEKGDIISHDALLEAMTRPREDYAMDNRSGHPKNWVAHTMFGGNSNCWWDQTPRFHPNDFRLSELYGIGAPWPIGYDDLEPYYSEVEQVMEIAGGGVDHIFQDQSPFPFRLISCRAVTWPAAPRIPKCGFPLRVLAAIAARGHHVAPTAFVTFARWMPSSRY